MQALTLARLDEDAGTIASGSVAKTTLQLDSGDHLMWPLLLLATVTHPGDPLATVIPESGGGDAY